MRREQVRKRWQDRRRSITPSPSASASSSWRHGTRLLSTEASRTLHLPVHNSMFKRKPPRTHAALLRLRCLRSLGCRSHAPPCSAAAAARRCARRALLASPPVGRVAARPLPRRRLAAAASPPQSVRTRRPDGPASSRAARPRPRGPTSALGSALARPALGSLRAAPSGRGRRSAPLLPGRGGRPRPSAALAGDL